MAQTSWQYPDNGVNVAPGDTAWTTPGNVISENGTSAEVVLAGGTISQYLRARLPTSVWTEFVGGSTVDLIEVRFRIRYNDAFGTAIISATESDVRYNDSTTISGSNLSVAQTFTGTFTYYTYSGTPAAWGINTANVATIANYVWLRVVADPLTASSSIVDAIAVRLTFTPPPEEPTGIPRTIGLKRYVGMPPITRLGGHGLGPSGGI